MKRDTVCPKRTGIVAECTGFASRSVHDLDLPMKANDEVIDVAATSDPCED
jgi:hypothetical protein